MSDIIHDIGRSIRVIKNKSTSANFGNVGYLDQLITTIHDFATVAKEQATLSGFLIKARKEEGEIQRELRKSNLDDSKKSDFEARLSDLSQTISDAESAMASHRSNLHAVVNVKKKVHDLYHEIGKIRT